MFSIESMRIMNRKAERAALANKARREKRRASETPAAKEARLNAFERDEKAAPWTEPAKPYTVDVGDCETCIHNGVHCSPNSEVYGLSNCAAYEINIHPEED